MRPDTVPSVVRSVTEVYWTLQASYEALRAIDETLPLVDELVRVQSENLKVERVSVADLAKARAQWHLYKQQQLDARLAVAQDELRLRNLLGLPPGDGQRLIPADEPARAMIERSPRATR